MLVVVLGCWNSAPIIEYGPFPVIGTNNFEGSVGILIWSMAGECKNGLA